MRNLSQFVAAISVATALAAHSSAQQFQGATNFPDGSGSYSEGIECADVDKDGDLDVIVADGDGFVSGTARQNKLYVNKFIETGTPYLIVDESAARFGTTFSCAKNVTTGDVNGDGWVDVLFSNTGSVGAGGGVPSLYINQGAANPGFFTLESATRGFTVPFFSGGASFADLDDDGDLDVVINDAFNTSPTKKLHLFINNGAGVFTENAAALNSPNRTVQMDVQTADMDNDWDIDVLGFTKMSVANGSHILLLNNGAGTFSDSSNLIAPSSGATYEADVADLDGDNDVDMFFVSLSGFAEGAVRNNLIGLGSFTFTNQGPLGATDDNEIAFIDYDNDGDYDILIGALGAAERMYRNDGNMTFVLVAGTIQVVNDSTLDCTTADLNNDGKYDILSANGESGSFINRFYRNTGTADTLAPVITSTNAPTTAVSGTNVVVKAKIRDQVLDDGVNYVTASADYVILTAPSAAAVQITAGAFSPPSLVVTAGTTVTFQNVSGVPQDVTSTTTPYTYASGAIANGGSYTRTFVKPGTYFFNSNLGALAGQITVTGTSNAALPLHMGGQMYRFRMNDTAGGAGIQLCYELRFRDWPGNTRVSNSGCITLTGGSGGNAFCVGDGSGPACPCGNNSLPFAGEGCLHSGVVGARLAASGTASVGADTLVLTALNVTGPGLFFQATGLAVSPVAFGDGQLCAAVGIVRMGVVFPAGSTATYPGGLTPAPISSFGATAGTPLHYQCWYRDAVVFCTASTFNTSSGVTMNWVP
ncbi:MAG: FG-GAP-like repeat-containing protein [Planctomycetota bacterium]|nr:FG-GAP-like repeat-containing protein [Planctomycetota bacterium]